MDVTIFAFQKAPARTRSLSVLQRTSWKECKIEAQSGSFTTERMNLVDI